MNNIIQEIEKLWHFDGHLNLDQRNFFIDILTTLKPKNCLEIGFATGRSTVTTLIAAKPSKMISIDIDLDYMNAREHASFLEKIFDNLKIIEGNSKNILNTQFFQSEFSDGIDFAFIDGGHNYQDAYFDISIVYPHINAGGIMIIDDFESGPPNGIYLEGVNRAVVDFIQHYNINVVRWNVNGKGCGVIYK